MSAWPATGPAIFLCRCGELDEMGGLVVQGAACEQVAADVNSSARPIAAIGPRAGKQAGPSALWATSHTDRTFDKEGKYVRENFLHVFTDGGLVAGA